MEPQELSALVILGTSGDLAKLQTFPAFLDTVARSVGGPEAGGCRADAAQESRGSRRNGQLGKALRKEYVGDDSVEFAGRAEFDLGSEDACAGRNWRNYSAIVNAAAYTAVDLAETTEGREAAWASTSPPSRGWTAPPWTMPGPSSGFLRPHFFDGSQDGNAEDEPVSPLGVYGQTKAAGDAVVSVVSRHYIVRTS